jgi:hypothetical protein
LVTDLYIYSESVNITFEKMSVFCTYKYVQNIISEDKYINDLFLIYKEYLYERHVYDKKVEIYSKFSKIGIHYLIQYIFDNDSHNFFKTYNNMAIETNDMENISKLYAGKRRSNKNKWYLEE